VGSLLVYGAIAAIWLAIAIGVFAAIRWSIRSLRESDRT
jgi:hypothetical protein